MTQSKINRHKSLTLFTEQIRANNQKYGKDDYALRIRGNERVIMKRLLHDYINAHNRGRVYSFSDYDSGKASLPAIVKIAGKKWLMTSNSLMASHEDISCVPETVGSWIMRWKMEVENSSKERDMRKIPFIEGVRYWGNDVALLLNASFFRFEEASSPHPDKPPDIQGKADIEGCTLTMEQLLRFKTKFNNKHAR